MKKFLLSSAGLLALVLGTPASAADMAKLGEAEEVEITYFVAPLA